MPNGADLRAIREAAVAAAQSQKSMLTIKQEAGLCYHRPRGSAHTRAPRHIARARACVDFSVRTADRMKTTRVLCCSDWSCL